MQMSPLPLKVKYAERLLPFHSLKVSRTTVAPLKLQLALVTLSLNSLNAFQGLSWQLQVLTAGVKSQTTRTTVLQF